MHEQLVVQCSTCHHDNNDQHILHLTISVRLIGLGISYFWTGTLYCRVFFFFQAEDGIRDYKVTGVQTCALPIFTGLSGSGKSSLAFDTIYAEGQRKYVESLSAYARQFLDQMQKPDVDFIEGLSPAIAIEQRSSGGNPRSAIATTTEIYDYLRLLYASVGQPHDPVTGEAIQKLTPQTIVDQILALPPETRIAVLAPIVQSEAGEFRDVFEKVKREGFVRVRVDGEMIEINATEPIKLKRGQKHVI